MDMGIAGLIGSLLLAALAVIGLYVIIRVAVCHGATDALTKAGLAKNQSSDT
jgi:hypothetical protein